MLVVLFFVIRDEPERFVEEIKRISPYLVVATAFLLVILENIPKGSRWYFAVVA